MSKLNAMRLKLLLQQEHQRISESQKENENLELSVVQARGLCWLALLVEAHEDQANHAEERGDTEKLKSVTSQFSQKQRAKNIPKEIRFPQRTQPRRAMGGNNVTQMHSSSMGFRKLTKEQEKAYIEYIKILNVFRHEDVVILMKEQRKSAIYYMQNFI